MTRDEAIQQIKFLYPADATYSSTKETGRKLLMQAIYERWEFLPDEILFCYAQLCQYEEQKKGLPF